MIYTTLHRKLKWRLRRCNIKSLVNIYRLMHALLHIRIAIIQRDRYRQRTLARGSISVERFELKRTKLTSHADTKLIWISLRNDDSPVMEKVIHWYIYRKAWYRVIRFLPRYLTMGRYRCGTSGVYVWAQLMLLFINMW
jgi:hypothetical protein